MAVSGKDTKIFVGKYNLTTHFRELDIDPSWGELEITVFGDGNHKFIPGETEGAMSASGFWDGTLGSVDEILDELKGVQGAVTVGFVGDTLGSPAYVFPGKELSYSIPVARADVIGVQMNVSIDGRLDRGVFVRPESVATATGNGTAVDNATSTAFGGAATIHAVDVTGTTPSLTSKIQHSVDNSVWVDLITFAALTTEGSELLTVAGTVNRYVREIHTISGTSPSFLYAGAFARRLVA